MKPELDFDSMRTTPVFRTLSEIAESRDASVGGKAYNLALLESHGFRVPEAVVLESLPSTDHAWTSLFTWWSQIGHPRLAARSSALGEDSGGASFAGQLTSVLEIESEENLKRALETCFASIDRPATLAYRRHFHQGRGKMNVVVQRMIQPLFSGVYFTRDPRGGSSWLIEAVEGLGESLVSGQVTPFRFSPETGANKVPSRWKPEFLEAIAKLGENVKAALSFDADIEWAIDQDGTLWVLQARPITTGSHVKSASTLIEAELRRLKTRFPDHTIWDGQTFSEWTGLPTPLSFSVWEKAFAPAGAFIKALRELGYSGETPDDEHDESLLDLVFGRACMDLNRLAPRFFGRIPYTMRSAPRAHLEFDWHRIDLPTILHAPAAIARMISVAWTIQNRQGQLLRRCEAELSLLTDANVKDGAELQARTAHELANAIRAQAERFAEDTLVWPFVLAVLAESALEALETVVAKDVGLVKARALVRDWMGSDLATLTSRMDRAYSEASSDPTLREAFLADFGHRGPGELDLAHPRWVELGEHAFKTTTSSKPHGLREVRSFQADLTEHIHAIRRPYVESEWRFLKALLELRERWKMQIMKPYFELRKSILKLGSMSGLDESVFWLELDELSCLGVLSNEELAKRILDRREKQAAFKKIALPTAFSLAELESLVTNPSASPNSHAWTGEPLSPGLASGIVRIVKDPADVDMATWPENVVLVAEATDPGWTPLFQRAVAIVVERGGVLSHCAIVAREMGLPAVSGILSCTTNLKEGDHVWVDGNTGRVSHAGSH